MTDTNRRAGCKKKQGTGSGVSFPRQRRYETATVQSHASARQPPGPVVLQRALRSDLFVVSENPKLGCSVIYLTGLVTKMLLDTIVN